MRVDCRGAWQIQERKLQADRRGHQESSDNTGHLIVAGEIGQKTSRLVWRFGGCFPATIVGWVVGGSLGFPLFPLESGQVVVSTRHGLAGRFGSATPLLLCPATILRAVVSSQEQFPGAARA